MNRTPDCQGCDSLYGIMLKTCAYCGKIHDKKYDCPQKIEAVKSRQSKYDDQIKRFRQSKAWTSKSIQIRKRDLYMCQVCLRGIYDTTQKYTTREVSVHHIAGLADHYDRRLDDDNLITLCRYHHELADDGRIPASVLGRLAREQAGKETDAAAMC